MSGMGEIDLVLRRDTRFTLQANFRFPLSGITVLFGKSGCGKTTLLRSVAGLEHAQGKVMLGDLVWQDTQQGYFVPTHRRRLGYVFQEASLFEHLSARDNIAFARKRASSPVSDARLNDIVNLLDIGPILNHKPQALSGGERQRVAIARALSVTPDALLMDEPLSALDSARKAEFLTWFERLRQELHIPILYVTHSVEEMRRLADHLVLLEEGRLLAAGNPTEVFRHYQEVSSPLETMLEGKVIHVDSTWQSIVVQSLGFPWEVAGKQARVGESLRFSVHARDVSLTRIRPQQSSIRNVVEVRIEAMDPFEDKGQVLVQLSSLADPREMFSALITAHSVHDLALHCGDIVFAQVKGVSVLG